MIRRPKAFVMTNDRERGGERIADIERRKNATRSEKNPFEMARHFALTRLGNDNQKVKVPETKKRALLPTQKVFERIRELKNGGLIENDLGWASSIFDSVVGKGRKLGRKEKESSQTRLKRRKAGKEDIDERSDCSLMGSIGRENSFSEY